MIIGDLRVRIYGDGESAKKKNDPSELVKLAYHYARPPSDASHLQHHNLTEYVGKRGNSAVFICPLCGHISDADIQASVCIALKQAFKETKSKEEWEAYKTQEGSARFRMWLDWIKTLQIPPIAAVDNIAPPV